MSTISHQEREQAAAEWALPEPQAQAAEAAAEAETLRLVEQARPEQNLTRRTGRLAVRAEAVEIQSERQALFTAVEPVVVEHGVVDQKTEQSVEPG